MTQYKGPSFRTVFIDRRVPNHPQIKELIFWGKIFGDMNLAPSYGPGSHGNLSFRHLGGLIITATRTHLKNLTPNDFVEVVDCLQDRDGMVVYCRGRKDPSTDAFIHFMIYKTRRDVRAIFHGHDQAVLERAGQMRIAQTRTECESGSFKLFGEIKKVLGWRKYLIVKNHGILSFGRSNREAGRRALSMHERAIKALDKRTLYK